MHIIFESHSKEFHLFNNSVSYLIKILKNKQLGHLYFGKNIRHRKTFSSMYWEENHGLTSCPFEGDSAFSLDYIKQEYPSYGTSDYTEGAYQILQPNGSKITNFEYKAHSIYNGKPQILNGKMPSTYASKNESMTLEITLTDKLIDMEIILVYTIFENFPVITRSVKFINLSNEPMIILNALSGVVDFSQSNFEMLQLSGNWSRERHIHKRKLVSGKQGIYSVRGASSAQHNPFLALGRDEINEQHGEVYGFSLIYSGNFIADVEVNHYDDTRVRMGINPFEFSWELNNGDVFETPEMVMVYSDKGLSGMSQTYHALFTQHLMRGAWKDKPSPVLINNWEATYFNFDETKILKLAKAAKKVGIELLVLDDGWFGKRNDDTTSLGDWFVDKNKLPEGIGALSKKVKALGIDFGLWFEPEMVNKESKLYQEHPDWVIETPNRRMSHGRNQYVLDFSRVEVVDYIYRMMDAIISDSEISYIKWDMNRNITEPFSLGLSSQRQGELFHRYIIGVYDLYDRLVTAFPSVLFESCSSGGGRFDPALLYYAPQAWTSDDTDAVERLKIQYGTSIAYPLRSMGSHISAVPNHQVGRITPLSMRANVAYFGTFGYELDITQMTEEELVTVKKQVAFYKAHRELIQYGKFYRLTSPFGAKGTDAAWAVVSEDKKEMILGMYRVLAKVNYKHEVIKLVGLNPETKYKINGYKREYYGDELMNVGLPIQYVFTGTNHELYALQQQIQTEGIINIGDYSSQVFHITAV